jgi:hypothetical protein
VLALEDLDDVSPLPFRRVLRKAEVDTLERDVVARFGMWYGGFPDRPVDMERLTLDAEKLPAERLEGLASIVPASGLLFELRESGASYELDVNAARSRWTYENVFRAHHIRGDDKNEGYRQKDIVTALAFAGLRYSPKVWSDHESAPSCEYSGAQDDRFRQREARTIQVRSLPCSLSWWMDGSGERSREGRPASDCEKLPVASLIERRDQLVLDAVPAAQLEPTCPGRSEELHGDGVVDIGSGPLIQARGVARDLGHHAVSKRHALGGPTRSPRC